MLNSPNMPLKVALLSISPHNRAILEFFFAGAGKKIFQIVSSDQAGALIVDFDHPEAEREWQQAVTDAPRPAIVLSVREMVAKNTVWVPKPLTSQSLVNAADKVQELLEAAGPGAQLIDDEPPEDNESASDMASLRAFMDAQNLEQAQPFGVSRHSVKRGNTTASVVPTNDGAAAGSLDDDKHDAEEHYLSAEDVYVPHPLEEEEIGEADGQAVFDEAVLSEEEQKEQEKRWQQLCGNSDEKLTVSDWHASEQVYTPENYLLNSLIDALRLSQQSRQYVQIQLDDGNHALLMPDVNLAYCSIDLYSDEFSALCDTPLQSNRVKLHLPSSAERAELEEVVQRDAAHTYDMEAMIWTTCLLTSCGRISRNANVEQAFRLKNWPNLTRLEQFPHVMQIAAAWQHYPGTLFDMSNRLEVPQRYVIALYNAAHTLGLFAVEWERVEQPQEKPTPKKNRGLFSRLLKRLLGGG